MRLLIAVLIAMCFGCGQAPSMGKPSAGVVALNKGQGVQMLDGFHPSLVMDFQAEAGESTVAFQAAGEGTDWSQPGRESAVVRLFLDGKHNQDIVLYQGSRPALYERSLGTLAAGSHQLRIEFSPELSSASARGVTVIGGSLRVRTGIDDLALRHAPMFWGREESFRSDVPMLLYYEQEGEELTYTLVCSNEDGGTKTEALMARWGRPVDIEWAYSVRMQGGQIQREIYQGWLHRTKTFKGRKDAMHPFLRISSTNNIFDDEGEGKFLFRFVPMRRPPGSREAVLDTAPWVIEASAKELAREGKIRPGIASSSLIPLPANTPNVIADPRNYLYLDFRGEGDCAFKVTLDGDSRAFTSHRGQDSYAISRKGWVRTTVELPVGTGPRHLAKIEAVDGKGQPRPMDPMGLGQALFLSHDFQPVRVPLVWTGDGWALSRMP